MLSSWEAFGAALGELNTLSVTVRLLLCMFCGGLIGFDRARKRRPAGLRTYMLVCLGSALVMITNEFLSLRYPGIDPARLGAQVISGIGFLGVGTIIVTRHHQVIGLTTAAGLWASACMGLAIGAGFYEGALISCALIAIIIGIMHRLDNVVIARARVMEVYAELNESGQLSDLLAYLAKHSIKVTYVELVTGRDSEKKGLGALLTLRLPRRCDHLDVLQQLNRIEGVAYVEEV